ncbi:hypothetical protein GOV04_01960 [Candidatus Woesearchaeota archaeon]|nr:hypothetical protein [Candidatus Woesearchaeota archaeon]
MSANTQKNSNVQQQKGVGTYGVAIDDLHAQFNSFNRRLRMLEERFSSTRQKLQVIEENMISNARSNSSEVSTLVEEIRELRLDMSDVKDKFKLMATEFVSTAKKEDFQVLKKYVELWEPINFVTRQEVQRIVKQILSEKEKL